MTPLDSATARERQQRLLQESARALDESRLAIIEADKALQLLERMRPLLLALVRKPREPPS